MTTKKRVGYRIVKKFAKYHLYILLVDITWKFFGLWPSKYFYMETHSAHYANNDAITMMNTLIEQDAVVVTSEDYDLKGHRTNIPY